MCLAKSGAGSCTRARVPSLCLPRSAPALEKAGGGANHDMRCMDRIRIQMFNADLAKMASTSICRRSIWFSKTRFRKRLLAWNGFLRQVYPRTRTARRMSSAGCGELYVESSEHSTETQGIYDITDTRLNGHCDLCPAFPRYVPMGRATLLAALRPYRDHPWLSRSLGMIRSAISASLTKANQHRSRNRHSDESFQRIYAGFQI